MFMYNVTYTYVFLWNSMQVFGVIKQYFCMTYYLWRK